MVSIAVRMTLLIFAIHGFQETMATMIEHENEATITSDYPWFRVIHDGLCLVGDCLRMASDGWKVDFA